MPKEIITAPAVRPSRRGLIANATPVDAAAVTPSGSSALGSEPRMPRWVQGFTWESTIACGGVLGPTAIHCMPAGVDKGAGDAADEGTDVNVYVPYALLGVDRCRSAFDRSRDRVGLATANLRATASWQAEAELWSSTIEPTNFGIGDATPVATGLAVAEAIGELEARFAECAHGVRGMLHVTPKVAAFMAESNMLRMDGDRLVTVNDNVVVVGAGYAAAAGSDAVAAITHQVHALLGPVVEFGGSPAARLDRTVNDEITFVEQPAALFADTCCAFVATDVSFVPTAGEIEVGDVTLNPGDVEIGAVEIKNATTDDRAWVGPGNTAAVADQALSVADPNVLARLVTIDGRVDGVEALLTAILAAVDGLEALQGSGNGSLTAIAGFVDGLETLVTATNTALGTIDGRVDGLEGLSAAANALLTTIRDNADTLESLTTTQNATLVTIDGRVDGLETLSAAANALLTTIRDNADSLEAGQTSGNASLTAIAASVDTLEALIAATNTALTTIDGRVDGLETLITATNALLTAAAAAAAAATTAADVTVDATAGGVVILAANAARKGAIIVNSGTATMRVRIGGDPTASLGIPVAAGAALTLSMPACPVGAIKAIREGGTSTAASVTEIT